MAHNQIKVQSENVYYTLIHLTQQKHLQTMFPTINYRTYANSNKIKW